MKDIRARTAATAVAIALLAALAACGDRVENNDTAQAPPVNVEVQRQGMEGAKDADAVVGVENKQAEQQAHLDTLGAKGGTSVLDPDVLISEQVKAALQTNPEFGSSSQVDVHSQDGQVTLRGRAPDPAARDRASDIARSVPNVRSVDNQLTLG